MEENKQSEKTAIVFDTNFIVEHVGKVNSVIKTLKEKGYQLYIPQVVVDERKAHRCNELLDKYNTVRELEQLLDRYIKVAYKVDVDRLESTHKNIMQNNYENKFGKNIIKYSKSEEIFSIILERAFKKIPPFVTDKSDKGFKDTLMWLSIIDYFRTNGEENIILLTSDNGFIKSKNELEQEFKTKTNKILKIEPNSFYNDIIKEEQKENIIQNNLNIPEEELEALSDEIYDCIFDICNETISDDFQKYILNRFTINTQFTEKDIENIFNRLEDNINMHILERSIDIIEILDKNDYVIRSESIPLKLVKDLLKLYKKIKQRYPTLIQQFYVTVTKYINMHCYKEPRNYDDNVNVDMSSDENVPF